jgi:hypothetical protein
MLEDDNAYSYGLFVKANVMVMKVCLHVVRAPPSCEYVLRLLLLDSC